MPHYKQAHNGDTNDDFSDLWKVSKAGHIKHLPRF